MVCTDTYLRRVEGRELPGKGRGVLWEAKLIYNSLYPEDFRVQKFIPILFDGGQTSYIPLPIRWSPASPQACFMLSPQGPMPPGLDPLKERLRPAQSEGARLAEPVPRAGPAASR
jgi:hypothetical protein